MLEPGDLVVVNNTRVRAARLQLHKTTGGAAEVLLLSPTGDPAIWTALVKPGKRLPIGSILMAGDRPMIEIVAVESDGQRRVRILDDEAVHIHGSLPLPPYINIAPEDPQRYQTVYARRPGSVAAPTAGLHLTERLLLDLDAGGIGLATIDLEVGLGTFAPMTTRHLDEHRMHSERYEVSPAVWDQVRSARRVVAVGTTVVRTLETVAHTGELVGDTDIFISPGFDWQVTDLLLTNFHMPRSTLLVLVEAFVGPVWRQLYELALTQGYGVGSFGDSMLMERADLPNG